MTALDTTTFDETTTPTATGEASSDARQNLIDYASLGGFTLSSETHAWYAAVDTVGSPEAARAASTVLAELRGRDLPATREAAARLTEETTLGGLDSVVAVGKALALTLRVRATLEVLTAAAYESDQLATLAAATASGRWRKEQDAKLTFGQRLNLGRVARGLAVAKRPRRSALHTALVAAATERTDWAAISPTGDRPALPADLSFLDASAQAVDAACEALAELGRLQVDSNPAALSLDALGDLVDRLASDEGTLHRLPALRALRVSLEEQGYAGLVAELTAARADAEAVAEAVVREFGAVDPSDDTAAAAAPATTAEDAATTEEAPVQVEAEAPQAMVPAPREENSTVTETVKAEAAAPAAEVDAEAEAVEVQAAEAEVPEVAEAEVVEAVEADAADDVAAEAVAEPEAEPIEESEPAAVEASVVEDVAAEPEATAVETEVEAEPEAAVTVAEPESVVDENPRAPRRPRKPAFTPGRPVTAYSADELLSVVQWIDSDGVKRTDDELLRAAMKELGFARLGPRIKEALGAAITTARS